MNLKLEYKPRPRQGEALTTALGALQGAATQAVATLTDISREGQNEAARVAASKSILDFTLKVRVQFGLEDRLKQLEAAMKSEGRG